MKMKRSTLLLLFVVALFMSIGGAYLYCQNEKEDLAIQTLGLRKNARLLYASVPVPNRDVTREMIATVAYHAPDARFEYAMHQISVDDGFPKEKPPRLVVGSAEIKVIGKDDDFYVEFVGKPAWMCDGVAFAICSTDSR